MSTFDTATTWVGAGLMVVVIALVLRVAHERPAAVATVAARGPGHRRLPSTYTWVLWFCVVALAGIVLTRFFVLA